MHETIIIVIEQALPPLWYTVLFWSIALAVLVLCGYAIRELMRICNDH